MLKLDTGDEKCSIVERLLGEAKRDLALDGLEKTAIAAGIGTTTAPHVPRAAGITTYLSNGGAVEHPQEMAAHGEAVRLHQGTAYPGVDVHQGGRPFDRGLIWQKADRSISLRLKQVRKI
jgi:hypothetical protein